MVEPHEKKGGGHTTRSGPSGVAPGASRGWGRRGFGAVIDLRLLGKGDMGPERLAALHGIVSTSFVPQNVDALDLQVVHDQHVVRSPTILRVRHALVTHHELGIGSMDRHRDIRPVAVCAPSLDAYGVASCVSARDAMRSAAVRLCVPPNDPRLSEHVKIA